MTTQEIISLSDQRLKELKTGFDPNTGEGSFINRFPFKVTPEGKTIHLPIALSKEYAINGSLRENCNEKDFEREIDRLITMRLATDFEFWAAKCAWITDKESEKIIPFTLNRAQRKALAVIYGMIEKEEPIRLTVLKSRQNGFSTLKQIFDAWIQLEVKENWHSTIVAQLDDQTRTIRSMYSRLLKHYPLQQYTYTSHEGSTKNKIIQERGCVHSIGSYEMPDSLRSRDIRLVHYCLHPDTPIITNEGFIKKIKDVKVGDRVVTHSGQTTAVKNIIGKKPDEKNGDGKALKITPWLGHEIVITPNHEVFTNHGWKRADELSNHTWLSMPIRSITNKIKEFVLPETLQRRHGGGTKGAGGGGIITLNYDFGYTVGYYLAEGSVHLKRNKKGLIIGYKELSFSRHDNEVEFGDNALKSLKGLYSSHNRNSVKGCLTTNEELHGSIISEFFYCNFGAKERKTIPDWVFDTNENFLKGILSGYLDGDGSKNDYFSNKGKYETALISSKTISSSIATQIRDIALSLRLGWGSIKYKPSGVYSGRNCKESWTTTWTGVSAKNIFKLIGRNIPDNGYDKVEKSRIIGDKVFFKIKKIEPTTVDYVYDIEVHHTNHSFRTLYFSVSNSEIGLWKETKTKNPKDIIASVSSAVPSIPWTFIAYESTAAGVANFFHKQWLASAKGEGYPGIFIPWFENVF